ncbi:MAG: 50S ribosomal protein L28 [Salibacteraceae bacterium]
MANICQITGKKRMTGNNVSHSRAHTKRVFKPNLHLKKFFIPEEDKWITLKVSASAIRTINKKGITACLKEAREKGFYKG